MELITTLTIKTEQYKIARALRSVGEAEGDPEMLDKAAAEFFDIQMFAAANRCRERARHYRLLALQETE